MAWGTTVGGHSESVVSDGRGRRRGGRGGEAEGEKEWNNGASGERKV